MKVTKEIFEQCVNLFSKNLDMTKKEARKRLTENVEAFEKYKK